MYSSTYIICRMSALRTGTLNAFNVVMYGALENDLFNKIS